MWPAEWRVVCKGGGLPSEAIKRRAAENEGEEDIEYVGDDERDSGHVIESY